MILTTLILFSLAFISPIAATQELKISMHEIKNPFVLLAGCSKYDYMEDLPGVEHDMEIFKNLFGNHFGYQVSQIPKNPGKEGHFKLTQQVFQEEIASAIEHLNKNHQTYDGILFAFFGHGDEKQVFFSGHTDKNQRAQDFDGLKPFLGPSPFQRKSLVMKPKIFFKVTCMGRKSSYEAVILRDRTTSSRFHIGSNYLTFYANTPGYTIADGPATGSNLACCLDQLLRDKTFSPKSLRDLGCYLSKKISIRSSNREQLVRLLTIDNDYIFQKKMSEEKCKQKISECQREMSDLSFFILDLMAWIGEVKKHKQKSQEKTDKYRKKSCRTGFLLGKGRKILQSLGVLE